MSPSFRLRSSVQGRQNRSCSAGTAGRREQESDPRTRPARPPKGARTIVPTTTRIPFRTTITFPNLSLPPPHFLHNPAAYLAILEKEHSMTRRIVLSILLALVILAGVAALGVYAYKAGVAQGLLQSDKLPALVPEGGRGFYPYHHFGAAFYHRPFGFGFGCFGLLLPVLFLFLLFGLLRGLLWPRPWCWRHGWQGPR